MSDLVRSTDAWEAELGQRVRAARKRARLSQTALATRANVSLSAIKSLEAGRGSTLRTFVGVIRALHLDAGLDRMFAVTSTVSPVAMLQARGQLKAGG
jgi:transcriptional regulator with XRE-family HTH domain